MTMGVYLHFCVQVKETQGNPLYKWPSNEDQLWLKPSNLLYDAQESENVAWQEWQKLRFSAKRF